MFGFRTPHAAVFFARCVSSNLQRLGMLDDPLLFRMPLSGFFCRLSRDAMPFRFLWVAISAAGQAPGHLKASPSIGDQNHVEMCASSTSTVASAKTPVSGREAHCADQSWVGGGFYSLKGRTQARLRASDVISSAISAWDDASLPGQPGLGRLLHLHRCSRAE